jgi:hypothetical protein
MPIEIRELVIKAVVTEGPSESERLQRLIAEMKQQILEDCRERLRAVAQRGNDR